MYSHPLYFNLSEHSSLLAPAVLSTRLHLPPPSHLLPPPHISVIFLPVTLHSMLPASCCSNSLSSCFQHHYVCVFFLFPEPPAPLNPSPCTNLPPQSAYLCLKPSYPLSRSPILPVISLPLYPAHRRIGGVTCQIAPTTPVCVCLCLGPTIFLDPYGTKQ